LDVKASVVRIVGDCALPVTMEFNPITSALDEDTRRPAAGYASKDLNPRLLG
jgi:hypothetical protein